jgi:hypothetical protein
MATTSKTSASDAAAMLAPKDTREALGDDPPPARKRRKTTSTYSRSSPVEEDETQRECNDDAATPAAATFQSNGVTPPPMQKEAPESVFGSRGDNDAGLRLIDVSSLKEGLQHLCCRECSKTKMDERMLSFFPLSQSEAHDCKTWFTQASYG